MTYAFLRKLGWAAALTAPVALALLAVTGNAAFLLLAILNGLAAVAIFGPFEPDELWGDEAPMLCRCEHPRPDGLRECAGCHRLVAR